MTSRPFFLPPFPLRSSPRPLPLLTKQRPTCTATVPSTTEHKERNITFQTSPHNFYRPASQQVRDLSVLALSALPNHTPTPPPYKVLDACSASGIRALRYLNPPCPPTHVHANDTHSAQLHNTLLCNLAPYVQTSRARVTNTTAQQCLRHAAYHLVDLDLFGSAGEPIVGAAIDAIEPHGLLYLCATDSVAGAGRNPQIAYAAYGTATAILPAANEQFLRLVIGAAHRAALARGRSITPVFSYFHRKSSTARVMLQLDHGQPALQCVGFLQHCRICGQNSSVSISNASQAYLCSACTATNTISDTNRVVASGPTWTGPLHDTAFLRSMRLVADGLHRPGDDWGSIMDLIDQFLDEAPFPPLFYCLGDIGKMIASSVPRVEAIGNRLKERGYSIARACATPRCVKTDAPFEMLVQAAREAAQTSKQRMGDGG